MPTNDPAPLALPDVNVLVALTNPAHVFHTETDRWLAGITRFATTPVTESGLVRMLLNQAVTGQVVTAEQALTVLSGVRADRRAEFLPDGSSLAYPAVETAGLAEHQQVTDWHLLNLAASRDGVLVTLDPLLHRAVLLQETRYLVTLG